LVEQAEHCEVDLGMAMVASRIDQSADPVASHQYVATPQIAVEKRRCRSRRQSVRKVRGQRFDAARQSGREMSNVNHVCTRLTRAGIASFTTLKHMAHNLIRKAPGRDSLRLKRKTATWDDDFLRVSLQHEAIDRLTRVVDIVRPPGQTSALGSPP
jgi:hypothetical protein